MSPEKSPGVFEADSAGLPLKISDHVWRIGAHHISMFLVEGDQAAAIYEVGIGCTAPLALAQLAKTGLPAEKVRYLVVSHAHGDHAAGQAGLAAALPNARLVLSPGSQGYLQRPGTLADYQREDLISGRYMTQKEYVPPEDQWPGLEPLLPGSPLLMEPGETLDLGGVEIRFFPGDGHAPGALVGFVPQDGCLLASDSAGYIQGGEPGFPLYFASYQVYMQELAALAALAPDVVAPGHQGWYTGPAAARYLAETRDYLEKVHQEILARLAKGETVEALGQEFYHRYWRDELAVFPEDTIAYCCRLLIKRSAQAE